MGHQTYNEAAINSNSEPHAAENKSDLVGAVPQQAWPQSQDGAHRIKDCEHERIGENIVHGEF